MIAIRSTHRPQGHRCFNRLNWLINRTSQNPPVIVCVKTLQSLPPGTFGHTWAMFLERHDRVALTTGPRRQHLYDGIHVLTGYGADPIGEMEVQAFLLGTQMQPIYLIRAIALLRLILHQRHRLGESSTTFVLKHLADRMRAAYRRGRGSVLNLETWRPEMLWDLPLPAVRRWFRV